MTHTPPPPDPTPTATINASQVALLADADAGTVLDVSSNINVFQGTSTSAWAVVANTGNGAVNIGAGADTGPVWSIGNVTVNLGAIVHGDVRTSGNLTVQPPPPDPVTGAEFTQDPIIMGLTTITATFPPLTTNDLVHNSGSVTVTPGSFRHLTINGGTVTIQPGSYGVLLVNGSASVVMSAGTYTFESITFNGGTAFSPSTGVGVMRVNVQNSFVFRASCTAYSANNVRFAVFGGGGATVGPGSTSTIFRGTIVAMNGPMIVEDGARTYRGAFFGLTTVVHANATIQHAAFSGWEAPSP